jgi:hypothetical protein
MKGNSTNLNHISVCDRPLHKPPFLPPLLSLLAAAKIQRWLQIAPVVIGCPDCCPAAARKKG